MLMRRTWLSRLLALLGGPALGYLCWLLMLRRLDMLRAGARQTALFHVTRVTQLPALLAYEHAAWAPVLSDRALQGVGAGFLLAVVLVLYALTPGRGARGGRARQQQKKELRERAELASEVKAELSPPLLADKAALRQEGWTDRAGLPLGELHNPAGTGGSVSAFIPPIMVDSHVLYHGTTGSGKTRRGLLPGILHNATLPEDERASLLVFDPKEELTDLSVQGMAQAGYAVYLYKPTSPGSVRCNVLADASSFGAVRRVMEQWLACQQAPSPSGAAGHYRRLRLALLVGAAWLIRRQRRKESGPEGARSVSLADVAAFYRPPRTLDIILSELEPLLSGTLEPQLADTVGLLGDLAAKPSAFADVMTELRDLMTATWDPAVVASMSGHDLGPAFWADFVQTPSVLYVPFAIRETRALRPVIVTFFDFAMESLRQVARGGRLARPVRVVIDEFANLGPVDRMEEHISTVRSSGIGFILATQTPGDISRVYGGTRASALEGNIATKMMLSGSDPEMLASWQMPEFGLTLPRMLEKDTMTVRRSSGLPFQVRTRDVSRTPYKKLVGTLRGAATGPTADLLAFQRAQLHQTQPPVPAIPAEEGDPQDWPEEGHRNAAMGTPVERKEEAETGPREEQREEEREEAEHTHHPPAAEERTPEERLALPAPGGRHVSTWD